MTAASRKCMNNRFTVGFFWEGERREVEDFCGHWPTNDSDASGLAFLAIKSWFENQNLVKPNVALNVELVANEKSYHWDTLPL